MIDIKLIRKDREAVEAKLKQKEPDISLTEIVALDDKLRHLIAHVETLKAKRNDASKHIGELKRNGKDATDALESVSKFASDIHSTDSEIHELQTRLNDLLSHLPNIPIDDIKVSQDPAENVEITAWGEKRIFDFEPKNHMELSEHLGLFDFKRGAKISGKGWPIYRGLGARIEWALLNYMLEVNRKNGFEQCIVPIAVRRDTVYASGQLPKFENQQFKITDEDFDLFLIPTAEVSLNGMYIDEIIPEEELPIKLMSYSPCFRREAGAAGEKERGLIRTHQFNKVELYCFSRPEDSAKIHADMCASATEILQGLGLHYRNMALVSGDMSFAAAYTVDIEAWLPGQDRYYEVSSISNCTDYQARRSNTRMRKKGEKPEFIHTLNGSGLATSRLMVSLLENNQNADGSVNVPEVLWQYMGGIQTLTPNA